MQGPNATPRAGHASAKTARIPPEFSGAPNGEWLWKAQAPLVGVGHCSLNALFSPLLQGVFP